VGEWITSSGLNVTNHEAFHEFGTRNITLKVTTIETIPYVMLKPGNHTGNDRFEGFCIELLQAIANYLGFQYELYTVPDGKFGAENTTTGEWNGLVREIIDKNADLAVASMTINYARESVIDFTKPFMTLGIGILFKLPSTMPTRLFSFMSPLAIDIWLYVLAAYILVSSTMFIVARFSPYEWHNPHPCVAESDVMENQFSMANSFWFTIVTLMHQGCSPWRDKISLAILDLQEKGVIQMLYNRWWKSPGITCTRDDKGKETKANALGLENIGGVFVVLLSGLGVAIITAIFEFCWNSKKNAYSQRQSLCSEMAEELRFAMKCRASRQRPALRRQCSKCIPANTYVPTGLEVPPQENGIMQMLDMRKTTSPTHFDCGQCRHHS
ncbi:glutamate receptor ionotropic: kainate 2-like protein, partial [Dinothrombium tinctorium]